MNYYNIPDWLKKFASGEFNRLGESAGNGRELGANIGMAAGFWDWFCKDTSLPYHVKRLAPKIRAIAEWPMINKDWVVQLKNCCPMDGSLYDMIQLVDPSEADGRVMASIIPASGHNSIKGKAEIWMNFGDNEKECWQCLQFSSWSALNKSARANTLVADGEFTNQ